MTYKHEKFDDSATLRSLEKIAHEKGWVETKPIVKSASNKLNLKPTSNLMQNLLNLCAGLRQSGLEKYAEELENKYVVFKQAATLYDVHNGETGEDLVDAAHPKGSHKMEGIDNAVFQTIVDKHLDMVKMVEKKPMGKLATSKDILNAVKIVLADSGEDKLIRTLDINIKDEMQKINNNINVLIKIAEHGGGLTDTVLNWCKDKRDEINNLINKNISNLTLNNLDDINSIINSLHRNLQPNALHNWLPDIINKGVNADDIWENMQQYFSKINNSLSLVRKQILKNISNNVETSPQTVTQIKSKLSDEFMSQVKSALRTLNIWEASIMSDPENNDSDKKEAKSWLDKKRSLIMSIQAPFNKLEDEESKAEATPRFISNLKSAMSDFATFKSTWIG